MAEWISVYCREPVVLDTAEIRRWIATSDLWTLAETVYDEDDLAEAAAESVFDNLRVHAGAMVEVYWTESGRPLQISVDAAVTEEVAEVLQEGLAEAVGPGPVAIRDHLATVRHVITIEMSAESSVSMGSVLGGIVAFELAAAGDGLVCFFGEEWMSPKDRAGALWSRT